MSRSGAITFDWADGAHTFRLAIGQLRELQEKCDAGPQVLLRRLSDGSWRVDDVRETIRLGLVGGGAAPTRALDLVRVYVDDRPLLENVGPAQAILMAALVGAPDGEAPGKPRRRRRAATTTAG